MIAFLFAGQGCQYPNMGSELYEKLDSKNIFDNIPKKLKEILLSDSEEINDTKYAQPAIFLISYLLASKLNVKPDYVAGLSLGEYTALAYSGVFTFEEGVEITSKRGVIMNKALENTNSGMYAVLGSTPKIVSDVVSNIDGVQIANFNCPGQIVITGYLDKLEKAVEQLKSLGVKRCIKLNVSGAFHSDLLLDASIKLKEELEKYSFKTPNTKIVFNSLAEESTKDIKEILEQQIKSSVLFEQSIRYMINHGVTTFIEIGSKNNLSNFVKKIDDTVNVLNVYDYESLMKVGELI